MLREKLIDIQSLLNALNEWLMFVASLWTYQIASSTSKFMFMILQDWIKEEPEEKDIIIIKTNKMCFISQDIYIIESLTKTWL